jgi:SpoVK/Ycf46/Vps4 family AAA+-type ATPase
MPQSKTLTCTNKNKKPFDSNLEYLTAHMHYLTSLAQKRMLQKRIDRKKTGIAGRKARRSWEEEDDLSLSTYARRLRNIKSVISSRARTNEQRTQMTISMGGIDLSLESLVSEHNLDEFEKNVLLLVLVPTLNSEFEEMVDDAIGRSCTDVGGILDLLCETLEEKVKARRYFTASGRLLTNGLLNLGYSRSVNSESDFLNMTMELPRRVSSYLLGEYDIDDELVTFSSISDPEIDLKHVVLPPGKKEEVLELVAHREEYLLRRKEWGLDNVLSYGKGVVMLFSGPSGTGKTMLAHALAKATDHRLMEVNIRSVLAYSLGDFEENLERVFHEARLQRALIFFDEADEMFGKRELNAAMPTLLREFEKLDGICILATNRKQILDEALERRILYKFDFELPPPELREQIWEVHLPPQIPVEDDINLVELADEFEISGGLIKNAVLLAMHRALNRPASKQILAQEDLRYGARLQRRNSLERQTDKIIPKVYLPDVVLESDVKRQVQELLSAARKRSTVFTQWGFGQKMNLGRALSVVFSGPSGVGKTMTAEAIAGELGQSLYVVNLAAILSKYVGDTEKNLRAVFNDAKEAHAVLFFDEADSLFSSRLDEGSSHAFYINLQVNSLLQEIEKFDGIVILATNRPEAFDDAFERRIRYRIEFSEPGRQARKAIWERMMPKEAPLADDIDFSKLSDGYDFTGGTIKNVVLRSAFAAATNGGSLTQKIIENAAEEESHLGRKPVAGFVS